MGLRHAICGMVLWTGTAHAGVEACGGIGIGTPIARALCYAAHEDSSKCQSVAPPWKETCLALAGSDANCNSLPRGAYQNLCRAMATGTEGKCMQRDVEAESWMCKAYVARDAGDCSRAGFLKRDCEALLEVLLLPPPETGPSGASEPYRGAEPVLLQLAEDSRDGVFVARLEKALSSREVAALAQEFSGSELHALDARMGTADLARVVKGGISAATLKDLVTTLDLSRTADLGADALLELVPRLTVGDLSDLLAGSNAPEALGRYAGRKGASQTLSEAIARHGAKGAGAIVGAWAAHGGLDAEDLDQFFAAAQTNGWKSAPEIAQFFSNAKASTTPFDDLIDWGVRLGEATSGSTTKREERATLVSPEKSSTATTATLEDKTGGEVVLTYTEDDAAYVASKHTLSGFALVSSNVDERNTFFPESWDATRLAVAGAQVLADPNVVAQVGQMAASDSAEVVVGIDGVQVRATVRLEPVYGVTRLVPTGGPGVLEIDRRGLLAAIALVKSR